MLLNKLTLITAILLVTLALAAGGTSLTFWAHATEPANQKKDAENLTERSNRAEAAKEDLPTDPNRLTGEDTKGSSEPAETQQGVLQPTKLYRGYSFTASPTGNVAFAYNLETQEVKAVRLNATEEHPIKVTPAVGPRAGVVGLHLEGRRSPGSPSSTSSRASGRPWTWTNRPAESSSRCPWAMVRSRTRSVVISICTPQRHPRGIV